MTTNEELIERLMDKVSDRVVSDLRSAISTTVENEIQKNISRALMEGEFFRSLNNEMQDGLKQIYREISVVKESEAGADVSKAETDELLSEASDQLDQIMQTTEQATVEIMDVVEKQLELQANSAALLAEIGNGDGDENAMAELVAANQSLGEDLMKIMTTLSFQDLTGQRIKKIITALRQIEKITFELFMSTGLKLRAKEKDPDRNIDELEQETRQQVSELKGPQMETDQQDVDDLLSQLGLE